jgi:hypothetical protein
MSTREACIAGLDERETYAMEMNGRLPRVSYAQGFADSW